MKRTALYTPSIWGAAALIVFTAMMGLADALLVAWWVGSVWGTAGAAGAIVGLVISIAWNPWQAVFLRGSITCASRCGAEPWSTRPGWRGPNGTVFETHVEANR
jgi:hypothetical protein